MVGPVSNANIGRPVAASAPTQTTMSEDASRPRDKSVGHGAKAMVAELKGTVEGLPKNIQGMAASSLARGMCPDAFMSMYKPADPVDDTGGTVAEDPVPGDEIPVEQDPVVIEEPPANNTETTEVTSEVAVSTVVIEDIATDTGEAALELLEAVAEDAAEPTS